MITKPIDVLTNYEVRKSKKQKTAFITAVKAYAHSLRYGVKVENGSLGCRNIVLGDAEKAEYLITAHYDTCAWMPLPNFITPMCLPVYLLWQLLLTALPVALGLFAGYFVNGLSDFALLPKIVGWSVGLALYALMLIGPANRHTANDNTSGVVTLLEIMTTLPESCRNKVCFVLFDLEEAGLLGSSAYRKAHKAATNRQIVINLDCVGDGDRITLIPCKNLRRQDKFMNRLQSISGSWGSKRLCVHKKGLAVYPSDQMSFPKGLAVAAFHRKPLVGFYMGRIHTHRDRVLDHTNVNILRAAIISLVANAK